MLALRLIVLTSLFFVCGLSPRVASAQTLPSALRIAGSYALSINVPPPLVPLESAQLARDLKRSRLMMAAGVGLALGGIGGVIMGAKQERGSYGEQGRLMIPLVAGSIVTSVGIGFTVAGGFRLAAVPEDYRKRHPAPPGPLLLGMGVFASTLLTMLAVSLPERAASLSD